MKPDKEEEEGTWFKVSYSLSMPLFKSLLTTIYCLFVDLFRISGKESRVAAFELLVVLCEGCPYNLQRIASQLINMHHQLDPSIAKEWEVSQA